MLPLYQIQQNLIQYLKKVVVTILLTSITFGFPLSAFAQTAVPSPTAAITQEPVTVPSTPVPPQSEPSVTQGYNGTGTPVPTASPTPVVEATPTDTPTENTEERSAEPTSTDSAITEDDLAPLELGSDTSVLDSYKDMTAVVRQSQDYTCGPASLATLMTQRGDDTTNKALARTLNYSVVIQANSLETQPIHRPFYVFQAIS